VLWGRRLGESQTGRVFAQGGSKALAEKALNELAAQENRNGGKENANNDFEADRAVLGGEMFFEKGIEVKFECSSHGVRVGANIVNLRYAPASVFDPQVVYLYKAMATPRTILCVDDDPDDRQFICAAITRLDPGLNIIQAHNGVEAMEYLDVAKEDRRLPCLIVLDINMPLMDGKQTLSRIKIDPLLVDVPVVMFSTSSNPMDKILFQRMGVDMITKPSDIAHLNQVVRQLLTHCA
jgi:CheY-like chemotaxis protein